MEALVTFPALFVFSSYSGIVKYGYIDKEKELHTYVYIRFKKHIKQIILIVYFLKNAILSCKTFVDNFEIVFSAFLN